jgi:hypothetical protein
MTTNEFYYMILVLAAFGTFAASVSLATLRYRAWLREGRFATAHRSASHGMARVAS